MTLDADPHADRRSPSAARVVIRQATSADARATGTLAAEREADEPRRCVDHHRRRLADPDHRLFVAEVDGIVVGYGWVSFLRPVLGGGHGAPDGWYLSGIFVAPEARRRGLGCALTRARIAWALAREDEVYYVVSSADLASQRLHRSLGMVEVTRDFALPGQVFTRCEGILCRLDRSPGAEVIDLAARRSRSARNP
ncbi:MAG: GNAT family N-acetyltransferase [Propioniciclava sp.]